MISDSSSSYTSEPALAIPQSEEQQDPEIQEMLTYLQSVHEEAEQIDAKLTDLIPSSKVSAPTAFKKTKIEHFYLLEYPNLAWNQSESGRQWVSRTLDKFKKLRVSIKYSEEQSKTIKQVLYDEEGNLKIPSTNLLQEIGQVQVNESLPFLVEWIQQDEIIAYLKHAWVFTILAGLQEPLLPDIAADMNSLLEVYIDKRKQGQEIEDEPTRNSIQRMSDSIIVIIGQYFKQRR